MWLKSLFDKLASFFGLIVLSPVLLVVAVLIRVKMPGGPVIFKQKRVGQHGRLFTMYKFRSMTVHHSGSSVSVKGESRITPLGAVLRKYKLDELPELDLEKTTPEQLSMCFEASRALHWETILE